MLFAPSNVRPEAEGFGSGFDDVGSIRNPVQRRFTERGLGNTVVHSEKGKLVVRMMAARSAAPKIHLKEELRAESARGTYPTSSSAISSYFCQRIISLRTWLFCLASTTR